MLSKNKKVNRLLDAMAVELCTLPDEKIKDLNKVINDKRDGYEFNFIQTVNNYRSFLKTGLVSVK